MEIYDEMKEHIKNTVKAKENDDIIIRQCVTYSDDSVQYGLLWYDRLAPYDCKVIFTSTQLNDALVLLEDKIMYRINKGIIGSYLFFQIQHLDAKLVSHNIITSSNYPYIEIHLHDKHRKIIYEIIGTNYLYTLVYDNLFYLKQYEVFRRMIMKLNKSALHDIYYETYGNIAILTKKQMIKKLLDNNKMIFIDNY